MMKSGLVQNCFVLAAIKKFGGAPAPVMALFIFAIMLNTLLLGLAKLALGIVGGKAKSES